MVYLPVVRRGELIGYLWAGTGGRAAGYMRRLSVDPDNLTCEDFWEDLVSDNYRNGLTAEQAVQLWIGHSEDPRCGGAPVEAKVQQANSMQGLWDQLNLDGPPMGEGPTPVRSPTPTPGPAEGSRESMSWVFSEGVHGGEPFDGLPRFRTSPAEPDAVCRLPDR